MIQTQAKDTQGLDDFRREVNGILKARGYSPAADDDIELCFSKQRSPRATANAIAFLKSPSNLIGAVQQAAA